MDEHTLLRDPFWLFRATGILRSNRFFAHCLATGSNAIRVFGNRDRYGVGSNAPKPINKGLFYAEWPKEKVRFHYRLEITYKDKQHHTNSRSIPNFPNTTFNRPDHHQASLYKKPRAIRASAEIN